MSAELYTERSEQTARTRAARVRMTHERRPAERSEHTTRMRVARVRTTHERRPAECSEHTTRTRVASSSEDDFSSRNTNFSSLVKLQHIILSRHHSRSEQAKQAHSLHLYNPMYIDSA